jgi:hypothetical protein
VAGAGTLPWGRLTEAIKTGQGQSVEVYWRLFAFTNIRVWPLAGSMEPMDMDKLQNVQPDVLKLLRFLFPPTSGDDARSDGAPGHDVWAE